MALYRITGRDFGEPSLPDSVLATYNIGDTVELTLSPTLEAILLNSGLIAYADTGASFSDLTSGLSARQLSSEKGAANGYAPLNASSQVPNVNLPPGLAEKPVVRDYTIPGPLTVSGGVLAMVMPTNYEGLSVVLSAPSAPVGAALIADVNRNGTTMFTTQANRPKINIGSVASAIATPNVTTGLAGDRLTFDVDQIDQAVTGTAPTWIGVDVTSPGAGITSYSVSRPASMQTGDLLLVSFWSQSATDPMWTPPASTGWSSAGASFSFNASRVHWFWRIDDGTAGPWLFSAAGSHTLSTVQARTIRGVHQTTPIDVYAVAGSASSVSTVPVPAITTVAANVLELLELQLSIGRTVTGLDGAYTVRTGFSTTLNRHVATISRATGGVQATYDLTLGGGAATFQTNRIGIKPAAAAAFTQVDGLAVAVRYLEA